MRKNVLQIVGSFHQGGSERQAVQLAGLLRDDKTFRVFLASLNNDGVLRAEAEKLGFSDVPEFRLTSFHDLNFLGQLRKCARYIKENNIEIVQTHDFYTNVFGISAARLAKVKVKIAAKRETVGMRSGLQKKVEKRIFGLADAIVANSKAVENYLIKEKIAPAKIAVVYNGLDQKRLEPQQTDRATICRELGLPVGENIKFVTLVANLRHEVKNQRMFLFAAQKISKREPRAHFVLAGEGELKSGLESLAGELNIKDKTHFLGGCRKVPELLAVSYAGVLTSFAEGFSNSILEYMWAKLPVVATDVGGAAEAIVENTSGFLIESNEHEQMANRLIELLEDEEKARRFGEKGRAIVESKFSCQKQLSDTLALYESKLREK